VLFSSSEVAQYINLAFEPAWETVRPVPIVTIDFGNGNVIKRTLHGNIATYVCTADGNVLDVLPGIYTPDVYKDKLQEFHNLFLYTYNQASFPLSRVNPTQPPNSPKLKDYHERQAAALRANQPPNVFVFKMDVGKASIEQGMKLVAADKAPKPEKKPSARSQPATKAAEIAGWKELADDTQINETARRLQIHTKLAEVGLVKPDAIVKWLYKDVLHADLDDPYLGLGDVLFKNYPFAEEDAKR
jgi:hypothetical protein